MKLLFGGMSCFHLYMAASFSASLRTNVRVHKQFFGLLEEVTFANFNKKSTQVLFASENCGMNPNFRSSRTLSSCVMSPCVRTLVVALICLFHRKSQWVTSTHQAASQLALHLILHHAGILCLSKLMIFNTKQSSKISYYAWESDSFGAGISSRIFMKTETKLMLIIKHYSPGLIV